ncbi:MAG: 50S ribosomal protein L9 [Bifidobacteriaceae bacterium]|jgi:large subunit ribosomal protein L9|nr:50S ribosomal protein L9 [Bifidobacteriaceae bacterium]MCI1979724.1 50S ribosomal protein L9 [Bifidobacteriaceae bacterium]
MAKETKVILRKTVSNLGRPGDVVEVKPGYARNFLIPEGFAFAWTKKAASQIEQMKRARRAKELASREDAVAAKAQLDGTVVEIAAKVSESGKLFGGVSLDKIASELGKKGIAIDAKSIKVDPIKKVGDFAATAQLHPEISAQFTIKVVAE